MKPTTRRVAKKVTAWALLDATGHPFWLGWHEPKPGELVQVLAADLRRPTPYKVLRLTEQSKPPKKTT